MESLVSQRHVVGSHREPRGDHHTSVPTPHQGRDNNKFISEPSPREAGRGAVTPIPATPHPRSPPLPPQAAPAAVRPGDLPARRTWRQALPPVPATVG